MTNTTIPAHIQTALEKVLGDRWSEERESYHQTPKEQRRTHLYKEMCIMRNWLYATQKT